MLRALDMQPVVDLLIALPFRAPHPDSPRRLVSLFTSLQEADSALTAGEIEDLIWAVWTDDVPDERATPMQIAIRAMATRDFASARASCDRLVARFPLWSEAWNKRATLAYLEERDPESIADILRTLELEPRHFGALSGLGQICLRQGEPDIARLAFEAALTVNPHMSPIQALLQELPPPPMFKN